MENGEYKFSLLVITWNQIRIN